VKVFLCNNRAGTYYQKSGRWVLERQDAFDFGDAQSAIKFAIEAGLKGVELILAYEDPAQDIALPLEKPSRLVGFFGASEESGQI